MLVTYLFLLVCYRIEKRAEKGRGRGMRRRQEEREKGPKKVGVVDA